MIKLLLWKWYALSNAVHKTITIISNLKEIALPNIQTWKQLVNKTESLKGFYTNHCPRKDLLPLKWYHSFTFRRLVQNVFSCFFGRVVRVSLAKARPRKAAVSALIWGFLLSKAATRSSIRGSRLIWRWNRKTHHSLSDFFYLKQCFQHSSPMIWGFFIT